LQMILATLVCVFFFPRNNDLYQQPPTAAIPSIKERRAAFELYCKNRVEEERAEKKQQQEGARERFTNFLKDCLKSGAITYKTPYEDFVRKYRDDPRMKLLDLKERESLFKESVSGLKDKEVESKCSHLFVHNAALGHLNYWVFLLNAERKVDIEKARKGFMELLRDTPEIDAYSRYDKVWKKKKLTRLPLLACLFII